MVEDEDQECSALSFPMRAGSKRIPNAYIKADIRRGEEQCVLVDKGKQECLSLTETGCTGRLTGSLQRGNRWMLKKTLLGRVRVRRRIIIFHKLQCIAKCFMKM